MARVKLVSWLGSIMEELYSTVKLWSAAYQNSGIVSKKANRLVTGANSDW